MPRETHGRASTPLTTNAPADFDADFDPDDVEWIDPETDGFGDVPKAHMMEVGILPGYDPDEIGDPGFVFKFVHGSDSRDVDYGRRRIGAAAAAEHIDAPVPMHVGAPERDGYVVSEGLTGGDTVHRADDDLVGEIDRDEYVEATAKQAVLGNTDAHTGNAFVREDGTIYHHDLDCCLNSPESEDRFLDTILGHATTIDYEDGLSWDANTADLGRDVASKAESIARSLSTDEIDRMVADVSSAAGGGEEGAALADELRTTVEYFQSGVELPDPYREE